jgi:hypothetical protein
MKRTVYCQKRQFAFQRMSVILRLFLRARQANRNIA